MKRKVSLLAFGIVLGLVLAACGGGDGEAVDTPTSSPASPTPTSAPATATAAPSTPTSVPATSTAAPPTSTPPAPSGDPAAGEQVFGSASPITCNVCHSLDGASGLGPTLQGIAARAGSEVSGLNAEEYIRQSILDPNGFVVDGFQPGLMPANFAETLSSQDIDNLVAFLLTQ